MRIIEGLQMVRYNKIGGGGIGTVFGEIKKIVDFSAKHVSFIYLCER